MPSLRVGFVALGCVGVVCLQPTLQTVTSQPLPVDIALTISIERATDNPDLRARVERIFGHFADAVFELTDGAYRLGRLRVIRDAGAWGRAQIRWSAGEGAPNVHGQGSESAAGGHIQFYDTFLGGAGTGQPKFLLDDESGTGYALAHEWAHYALGIYDEHPVAACGGTATPMNTLMANPWRGWLNLSAIPPATSCQALAYGAPAWTVLARPPSADPRDARSVLARSLGPRRPHAPLVAAAPSAGGAPRVDLPSPLARGALTVEWLGQVTTIELLIARHHLRPETLNRWKYAAARIIDTVEDGRARIGISMFDRTVTRLVAPTLVTDATTRGTLKAAIATITRDGGSAPGDALARILAELATAPAGDARSVVMMATGETRSGADPVALIPAFVSAGIPIHTLGLDMDDVGVQMQTLADGTGGALVTTADLEHGIHLGRVATEVVAPVTAVARGRWTNDPLVFTVDASMTRLMLWLNGAEPTTVRLRDPSGARHNPIAVELVDEDRSRVHYFDVPSPRAGRWELFYIGPSRPTSGTYEISARQTTVGPDASLGVHGSTHRPDLSPVVLEARLSRHQLITGAAAVFTMTHQNGTTRTAPALDTGQFPDGVAGDGVFTGTVTPWAGDATYTVDVTFTITEGAPARETFRGTTIAPAVDGTEITPPADRPVTAVLTRAATTSLFVQAGAIRTAPTVTLHPAPADATRGDTVEFTVGALSDPAPSYRWQRKAAGAMTWMDLADGTLGAVTVTGASTAALRLSDITPAHFGDAFRVVVANTTGQVVSDAALLSQRAGTLVATPDALVFTIRRLPDGRAVATPAQPLTIWAPGRPPVAWTVSAGAPWMLVPTHGSSTRTIEVAVRPDAPPGAFGAIVVSTTATPAVSLTIPVTVHVTTVIDEALPFGQVETPTQHETGVRGAIAFTGWTLDDTGVATVRVYRACLSPDPAAACQTLQANGEVRTVVYLGEAAFVEGARPDVEVAHPHAPQRQRAGWGFVVLTNLLPDTTTGQTRGGQGRLSFSVLATDVAGNQRWIGRTTTDSDPTILTLDNDALAAPFGAVDTPAQGATVHGWIEMFGWALTPDTDETAQGVTTDIVIPRAGALRVFVDGAPVGLVDYGLCRGTIGNPPVTGVYCNDDIASVFGHPVAAGLFTPRTENPTRFRNLDSGTGAIGHVRVDSTALTNGLHSLAWAVTDSAGRTAGLGSRYVRVMNDAAKASPTVAGGTDGQPARRPASSSSLWVRTGFSSGAPWAQGIMGGDGQYRIELDGLSRLELRFGGPVEAAVLQGPTGAVALPLGSSVSGSFFYWTPLAAYRGEYGLTFTVAGRPIDVAVSIR